VKKYRKILGEKGQIWEEKEDWESITSSKRRIQVGARFPLLLKRKFSLHESFLFRCSLAGRPGPSLRKGAKIFKKGAKKGALRKTKFYSKKAMIFYKFRYFWLPFESFKRSELERNNFRAWEQLNSGFTLTKTIFCSAREPH
jgi:hypothetical protein